MAKGQRGSRREAAGLNPHAAALGPRRSTSGSAGGVGKRRGPDEFEPSVPTGPSGLASKRRSKTARILTNGSDGKIDVRITGWKDASSAVSFLRRKTQIPIERVCLGGREVANLSRFESTMAWL